MPDRNAPESPPEAAIHEARDIYHGHEIIDPYRWMEEPNNAEFETWLKAQSAFARRALDRLPLAAELRACLVRSARRRYAGLTGGIYDAGARPKLAADVRLVVCVAA